MLHIRPVSPDTASDNVQAAYSDIKATLGLEVVPLVFQYLAGFEEYFLYVWDKVKQNMESSFFQQSVQEVVRFSQTTIPSIYRPSRKIRDFVVTLHPAEKQHIQETISQLQKVNAQLMLITQGMREGLKGVTIGTQLLQQVEAGENVEEEIFDKFINNKIMRENLQSQQDIEPASKMLAPLFGSSSLVVSRYPAFFSHVAEEVDELVKTERYLHTRVGLERVGIEVVYKLPYSLGTSYREIVELAGRKPYIDELLYILSETFPTKFPRLVLTTALMHTVLQPGSNSLAIQ